MKKNKQQSCKTQENIIYIIRPRSSIEGNLNVYKIGKTDRYILKRLSEYEKGSELYFTIKVKDCTLVESKLKEHLKKVFINRRDFGDEYFETDIMQLINAVAGFCLENYDCRFDCVKGKYEMIANLQNKSDKKYICKECNFSSNDRGAWSRHKRTKKHENLTNVDKVKIKSNILLLQNENKILNEQIEFYEKQINIIKKELSENKKELSETKKELNLARNQLNKQYESIIDKQLKQTKKYS